MASRGSAVGKSRKTISAGQSRKKTKARTTDDRIVFDSTCVHQTSERIGTRLNFVLTRLHSTRALKVRLHDWAILISSPAVSEFLQKWLRQCFSSRLWVELPNTFARAFNLFLFARVCPTRVDLIRSLLPRQFLQIHSPVLHTKI